MRFIVFKKEERKSENRRQTSKGSGEEVVLFFVLPIILTAFLVRANQTMCMMIVGNALGEKGLANIGTVFSGICFQLLFGLVSGFGYGGCLVVARRYGADDQDGVKRSVAIIIVLGLVVVSLVMIVSQFFLYPLLDLLRTPAYIVEPVYAYVSSFTIFVGVFFLYYLFAGLLQAIGNSFVPFLFFFVATVIQGIMTQVLVVTHDFDINGIGIAAVLSHGIVLLCMIRYIYCYYPFLIPEKKHFRMARAPYLEVIGQGVSMVLFIVTTSNITDILQLLISNGEIYELQQFYTRHYPNAFSIFDFCYLPILSLPFAVAIFVAQNKGANQKERIRQVLRFSNSFALIWGGAVACLLFFVTSSRSGMYFGYYGSPYGEVIMLQAVRVYLVSNSLFYGALGTMLNLRSTLQGVYSLVRYLLSILLEFGLLFIIVKPLFTSLTEIELALSGPLIWTVVCVYLGGVFHLNPFMKIED